MSIKAYFSLVKFSHTVFALPFAIIGFSLGYLDAGQPFNWTIFLLMLVCMITARNAAMAFNRYLDRDIDGRNERTKNRDIPAGNISSQSALVFVFVNVIAFVVATFFINALVFYLSPIALFIILIYSQMKKISFLCHYVLGLGLGLAPLGAYLAVTGQFSLIPILLGVLVMTWVAGFDIVYALNDRSFDQDNGLYSVPQTFGLKNALKISEFTHFITACLLVYVSYLMYYQYSEINVLWLTGAALFLLLLIYQHLLVSVNDLSRINLAFFTTNGVGSIVIGLFLLIDLFLF